MSNLRKKYITDEITGVTAEVNADKQLLVEAEIVDDNGLSLELTAQSNIPIEIFDASGNSIHANQDADGNYHLSTSVIQEIITSTNNATTDNLASAATFTGSADETFGISGIQLYHAADQDCTIYIDQSGDSTFADSTQTITDTKPCLANIPCSRTIISVAPYYRLRVTNTGDSATTKLTTQSAMTPIINPLPRALTADGRLMSESTLVGQQNTDRHAWMTPTNALLTETPVRLIGTNFDGTVKNTYFWTETLTGSGSITKNGELELSTGTTADSTVNVRTVSVARYVVGAALRTQYLVKYVTAATANNIRRSGAYFTTDGFFFQLDNGTFSIGTRKASIDILISSGGFNGNYGPNFTPDNTTYYKQEIEWTPKGLFFYIDGILLHKMGVGHYSNYLSLPMAFENINSNGSTTDVVFDVLAAATSRLGHLNTQAKTVAITTNTTTLLKSGPGMLQRIINTDNAGDVLIYDNVTAVAPLLTSPIDTAKALGNLPFNAPFNTGLTIVTTGGAQITVTFE